MDELLRGTYFMEDPFTRSNVKLQMMIAFFEDVKLTTRVFVVFTMAALLLSSAVTKVALLVNNLNDLVLLAELIPWIATLLGCLLIMVFEQILKDRGLNILKHLVQDIRQKRSEAEVAIKKTYERNAVLLIRITTVVGVLGVIGLVASLFIPHALDVILPINETRPRELPFHGEHFVDEEKYFYYIAFSQYMTTTVVVLIVESLENVSIISFFHMCGVMAVFGYKVENMVQIVYGNAGPNAKDYNNRIVHEVKACCNEYKKAMAIFAELNYITSVMVPFLLLITFICFSMLLVTLVNVESIGVSNAMYTFGAVIQFALVSFLGQYVVNESSKLQYNVYNGLWYNVPAKLQRLFLLILMRTQKPFVVTAATYDLTIGNFATVAKTAASFCMVLKEVQ